MNSNIYSIQELCDQTGLPRRTIHFYSQQGIIPPPSGAGLGATYDDIHLARLRLVPLLRQKGLRLDEIRTRFNEIPPTELQHVFDEMSSSQPAHKSLPVAKAFLHYSLPAGLVLIAPSNLSPVSHAHLEQLLKAAQEIFSSHTF